MSAGDISALAWEARKAVANAILHERVDDVLSVLKEINEEPALPCPPPELFMASRLVVTEVSTPGLRDVAEMLEAIEEGDDGKFAGVGAAFFGIDNRLGNVLAAFAFDPDDTGREPETIAFCQRVIRELAKKWRVEVSS